MSDTTVYGTPLGVLDSKIAWTIKDAITVMQRNLIRYVRVPQMLVFSTIQPIMFVLLFRYVLGGAIHPVGYSYVNYLIPGIFLQSVSFGTMNTAVGLSEDLQKGLIERFRSLPMARSAVLAGRTLADLCRNIFVVIVLTAVALAVGFRPTTLGGYGAGVLLLLAFAYAASWGMALIGLSAKNAESAQAMVFPILFPLTFASSAFAPVATMPKALQVFARNQPVTIIIDATRHLMVGGPINGSVLKALAWTVGMVAVFAPLAVHKYKRAVS